MADERTDFEEEENTDPTATDWAERISTEDPPAKRPANELPSALRESMNESEGIVTDEAGDVRFELGDSTMDSHHDDEQAGADIIKIAQHRGWQGIDLEGSEAFRRGAWMQSELNGIRSTGYDPTEQDYERLAQAKTDLEENPADERGVNRIQESGHNKISFAVEQPSEHVLNMQSRIDKEATPVEESESTASDNQAETREPTEAEEDAIAAGEQLSDIPAKAENDANLLNAYRHGIDSGIDDLRVGRAELEDELKNSESEDESERLEDELRGIDNHLSNAEAKRIEVDSRLTRIEASQQDEAAQPDNEVRSNSERAEGNAERTTAVRDMDPREMVEAYPDMKREAGVIAAAEAFASEKIDSPDDQSEFVGRVREEVAERVSQGQTMAELNVQSERSIERVEETEYSREHEEELER